MKVIGAIFHVLLWVVFPKRIGQAIAHVRDNIIHPPQSLESLIHGANYAVDHHTLFWEGVEAAARLIEAAHRSAKVYAVVYLGSNMIGALAQEMKDVPDQIARMVATQVVGVLFYVQAPTTMEIARAFGGASVSLFFYLHRRLPRLDEVDVLIASMTHRELILHVADEFDKYRPHVRNFWSRISPHERMPERR